ncbi:hypothetical protein R83H12_02627 [Fibrobacteria bacterium R8-3-H12]
MFLRLFLVRFFRMKSVASGEWLVASGFESSSAFFPVKYFTVGLFGNFFIDFVFESSFGFPVATTSPPNSPAFGPKSTMWSIDFMNSKSCSTTTIVFPKSRSL